MIQEAPLHQYPNRNLYVQHMFSKRQIWATVVHSSPNWIPQSAYQELNNGIHYDNEKELTIATHRSNRAKSAMVVQALNPNSQEAEAGSSL